MAPWHFMLGIGIGLVATLTTTIIAIIIQRSREEIPYSSFVSPPDVNCPVCLFNISNDDMGYLHCGHAIHQQCVRNLRRYSNKCPICRRIM